MANIQKQSDAQPTFNWSVILWTVLIWLLLINILNLFTAKDSNEISYTDFKEKASQGLITEITIRGDQISGTLKTRPGEQPRAGPSEGQAPPASGAGHFTTVIPALNDPELIKLLEKNQITIKAQSRESSWLWTMAISLLPWIIILGLILYSSKQMRERLGGPGGPFGFGKSKAKLYMKNKVDITFENVAGLENAKKELREVIEFLKRPEKFQGLGGELPKGILLVGPPGTGKTLMARATAGEAGVAFFSISGSEFIEMFVGVGASRVRDMFETAKKSAPAIIFIDEIDSIGRVRGTGLGGGHDEREQTLNQILSEMDGFSPHESVILMAATNRPDVLDPALIRPGRFDRQVTLDLPQREARLEILRLHAKKSPLAEDVDLENIAARTVGFSGADLKNLVNEAALMAARKNKKQVEAEDFEQGRDKIILGLEREDHLDESEKKVVACHEAGHALTSLLVPDADPLKKVTIIPRGRSLGATEQMPSEDRHNFSEKYLFARLCVMLGGHAAEHLVYGEITSGAGDDLKKATQLARAMICQWGMSEKLGPVAFRQGELHPFLGRELTEPKDFSEETARIIDEEVRDLLRRAMQTSADLLKDHRDQLDLLARALLERETLSDGEISELLKLATASG